MGGGWIAAIEVSETPGSYPLGFGCRERFGASNPYPSYFKLKPIDFSYKILGLIQITFRTSRQ